MKSSDRIVRPLFVACALVALAAPALAQETSPSPIVDANALAGRWRIRIEAGSALDLRDANADPSFGGALRFSVDLRPVLAVQAGFGMEGLSAGLRLQHMLPRGWQIWIDGTAGFRGWTNLPPETMWGFGTGAGASLRVNDRFLLGPYLRYTHHLDTATRDADLLTFGLQLDLVIARRAR